jgi:hypothetical protein
MLLQEEQFWALCSTLPQQRIDFGNGREECSSTPVQIADSLLSFLSHLGEGMSHLQMSIQIAGLTQLYQCRSLNKNVWCSDANVCLLRLFAPPEMISHTLSALFLLSNMKGKGSASRS